MASILAFGAVWDDVHFGVGASFTRGYRYGTALSAAGKRTLCCSAGRLLRQSL